MALPLTTLTGTILQPDDITPCHGSVVLKPGSGLLVSAADNRILAGEITVPLDDTGSFSVALPSTDNVGTQPEPNTWNWSIRFRLTDASIAPFSFALPASPAEVDLADVARVAPAPGTYIVVPGPAGPKGDKGDPGDIGAGALLAANNLADLDDVPTARTNLGLGTAATQASSAFDAAGSATTAQAAAEATAATDATAKAGTAQANAISTAATDAAGKVSAHTAASDPHGDRAAAAADATTKADAAQSSAVSTAATDATAKVTAHTGAADPHGDRSFATGAVSTHAAAVDPHGDRAAATSALSGHVGAADPHGDRSFATSAVSTHTAASDPHGDRAFTTSAVTTHAGAVDPHGDRAAAATDASSKVTAHVAASDPHGDRGFATTSVSTHAGASDPHGDRAFTTSAVTTHVGATDPHGDRADAATKYLPLAGGAVTGSLTVAGHALRAPQAADHGLRAWAFDVRFCGSTAAVATAGTLFLSGMFITESFTAAALYWGVSVAPTSQTAGQNFVGLYDSTGTLLTSVGVDADTATTGLKTATINVALTPGTYWAAFLFNASTAPQLPRCAGTGGTSSLINVGLSGANLLYASNGTGRTALPSSITMSSNVASTGYWAAIK